mgnify:CR=1 FL=1
MSNAFVLKDNNDAKKQRFKIRNIFNKEKSQSLKDFDELLPYIKQQSKGFMVSFVAFMVATGLIISIPLILREVITTGLNNADKMLQLIFLFSLAHIFKIGIEVVQKLIFVRMGERVLLNLRKDMTDMLAKFPMKFFDLNSS